MAWFEHGIKQARALECCIRTFGTQLTSCFPCAGEYPTLADWTNHLTTIFPDVRLKKFLEMRGADGGPWRMLCALPALWVGLIYDPQAQSEALALIEDWTPAEREYLRTEGPKLALHTPFRGGTLQVGDGDMGLCTWDGFVHVGMAAGPQLHSSVCAVGDSLSGCVPVLKGIAAHAA